VVDAAGQVVRVTARGGVSAPPVTVTFGVRGTIAGSAERVQSWAGPWPVEERWWDATRTRRIARFQLLTVSGRLLLAVVERGTWALAAEYA
jgi:protein ImuB